MYPTSPQYRHSIANKMYPPDNGGYIFSPILENDEPKYESGNKAIVFKVTDDKTEKTKALKLFLIDNKERFFQYLEMDMPYERDHTLSRNARGCNGLINLPKPDSVGGVVFCAHHGCKADG